MKKLIAKVLHEYQVLFSFKKNLLNIDNMFITLIYISACEKYRWIVLILYTYEFFFRLTKAYKNIQDCVYDFGLSICLHKI